MTQSESNLINLFSKTSFNLSRITEGENKTPDFFIHCTNQDIYIEVKEITENDSEKDLRIRSETYQLTEAYSSPAIGSRFRDKIRKANAQLRVNCTNGQAGIVVIQDVRPFESMSLMPQEEIKQAMFGDRETWLSVDEHKVTADLFGKNKTINKEKNTSVSAVGLLIKNLETSNLTLHLYHNPYAKNKLLIGMFNEPGIYEYKISNTKDYDDFMLIEK